MAFEFGTGFSMGGGFSMKPKPADPLAGVEYTDDLQADSLAELEALRAGMAAAPPEFLMVLVFRDREAVESFMWRRHLDKAARFVEGQKAVRALKTPQASGAFSMGGGFALKSKAREVDADAGWVDRAKQEKSRFTLATDPEYYVVISFDSEETRGQAIVDLGLAEIDPLPIPGGLYLPGPAVDEALA